MTEEKDIKKKIYEENGENHSELLKKKSSEKLEKLVMSEGIIHEVKERPSKEEGKELEQEGFSSLAEKQAFEDFFVKNNGIYIEHEEIPNKRLHITKDTLTGKCSELECERLMKYAIGNKFYGKFLEHATLTMIDSLKFSVKQYGPSNGYQAWSHSLIHLFAFHKDGLAMSIFDTGRWDLIEKLIDTAVEGAINADHIGCTADLLYMLLRFNLSRIDSKNLNRPLPFKPNTLKKPKFIKVLAKSYKPEYKFAFCMSETQKELFISILEIELKNGEFDILHQSMSDEKIVELINAIAPEIGKEKAERYLSAICGTKNSNSSTSMEKKISKAQEEIKGVYVDVEGTLIYDDKTLNHDLVRQLEEYRKNGKIIKAFTGADPSTMEKILKQFKELEGIITFPVLSKNDFKGKLLEVIIDDTPPEAQELRAATYIKISKKIKN